MILLVDDSIIVRSLVKYTLQSNRMEEIIEAEDGLDAIEKYKSNMEKIRLCVLDLNMPKLDGISVVNEIRKLNRDIPILMLTAESSYLKMKIAKDSGATGWFVKPFQTNHFINVVQLLLQNQVM